MSLRRVSLSLSALMLTAVLGCSPRLPPIVPVEGIVRIDGKPLPKAVVTFMPLLDHFGAESNSTAETDESGHFVLMCRYNDQPGAVTGTHIVLINEAPLPSEFRMNQDGRAIDRYLAKLGNRPIPPNYTSASRSPLRIEIKADQAPLTIDLTR